MSDERTGDRGVSGCSWSCRISRLTQKAVPLIAAMATSTLVCGADAPVPSEYQVKAAFLYNFAKFVDWPVEALPESSTDMILCILGEDPFGTDLEETVQGKLVNGRRLGIKRFKSPSGLKGCHILFISSSEGNRVAEILATLRGASVLTIGEMERFARLGGIINFTMEDNKVRFEINVDAAAQAGLKISSKVLKLATIVRGWERE
jgi:hypothetical protein